jgi:15-cis-phytoene desaturase
MQVVAQDYPKPAIETSGPYLEAAALSAKLREAPRPERPLRVVIAGAGSWAAGLHAQRCMR